MTNDIAYDQRMQKTAKTLHDLGHTILMIGRVKKSSIPCDLSYSQVHRFEMFFLKGKFFYIEYNLRLFFFLLFSRFDILVAVDLDTILPNVIVGSIRNKPVIYDAHEYFTEVPELTNRRFEKSIWKWIERISIPPCAGMYTVSQGIADIFSREYGKQCDVIYNFPTLITKKENLLSDRKIILYQGDLNEGRGLDCAIRSMPHIPHVELWIVGDGYDRESLERLTSELNMQNRVTFWGYIEPASLHSFTSQAYLGLNLLENKGLNHYYSLANKYFDYIQQGVPPISMNFPEYQHFNNLYHCSILIDELTVESFVQSVCALLNNQKSYEELVKNCDIAGQFLNWESQEEKLSSIYNNV